MRLSRRSECVPRARWTCCSTWCGSTRWRSSTSPSRRSPTSICEYLAVLEQLDVNAVGDFLAMASLLIEIKSQQVLPRTRRGGGGVGRPAAGVGSPAVGIQEIPRRGQHPGRAQPQLAAALSAAGRRPAAARARPGRRADPRGRVVGPGQRLRPDHARDRGRAAVEHRLRRHADPRLHEPHPRPAAARGGRLRSANCSSRACTNRRWSAFFWPCWNWSATIMFASSRTRCSAKSGLAAQMPLDSSNRWMLIRSVG